MNPSSPADAAPLNGPKQKRSLQSQESILLATERLLARKGCTDFTLLDLSRESGMSVGGIYRRFVDKDGLMLVLQQRLNQRMLEQYVDHARAAGAASTGLKPLAASMIAGMADTLREHGHVLRKIVEGSLRHAEMARHGIAAYHAHLDLFKQALLVHRAEIRHAQPELAIDFCFNAAYELIASHLGFGRPGTVEEPDWSNLVRNLQRLCVNYLAYPGLDDA